MVKCQNCGKKIEKKAYQNGKVICQKCWELEHNSPERRASFIPMMVGGKLVGLRKWK